MNFKKCTALILTIICLLSLISGCETREPTIKWSDGSITDGVYTNRALGLTFQIPEGWSEVYHEPESIQAEEDTESVENSEPSWTLQYDVDLCSPDDNGRMFVLHCDLFNTSETHMLSNNELFDTVKTAINEEYGVLPSSESVILCGTKYDGFSIQAEDFSAQFCVHRLSKRELVIIGIFGQNEKFLEYYTRHFTKLEKAIPKPPVSSPVKGHGSFSRGDIYGGIYTSSYLKLRFTPPEKWIYAFDEELDELMGASFEIIGDDVYGDQTDYAKAFARQTVIYDMVCASPDGSNVQILLEDLKKINGGTSLTAEDYAEIVCSQLKQITDYSYELSDVHTEYLAGTLYTVLDAEIKESKMQQQFWLLRVDEYMLCIAITNINGSPTEFLSCFSEIN